MSIRENPGNLFAPTAVVVAAIRWSPVMRESARMSDAARRAALDRLAVESMGAQSLGIRRYTRIALPEGIALNALIQHPGGGEIEVRVVLRDISRGGFGMFHGGYLHPGTRVISTFIGSDGAALVSHPGKVVRCTHLQGLIHDVGIAFDTEFPLEMIGETSTEGGPTKTEVLTEIEQIAEDVAKAAKSRQDISVIRTKVERLTQAIGNSEPAAEQPGKQDAKSDTAAKPNAKPKAA